MEICYKVGYTFLTQVAMDCVVVNIKIARTDYKQTLLYLQSHDCPKNNRKIKLIVYHIIV